VFLWRLAQQSIPTADLLHHRKMATTSRCRICGNEDSWRHSLMECTMSRCVWALEEEQLLSVLSEVTEPDARRWIFTIMEKLSSSDFMRALVTLWAIWHARRKAVHENIFQSPAGTHLFVDRFISEISASRPTQQNQVRAPTVNQRWTPPPPGHCKIKVDGATTKSARRGSVGVICRAWLVHGSFSHMF
jgi:hypothetical protein